MMGCTGHQGIEKRNLWGGKTNGNMVVVNSLFFFIPSIKHQGWLIEKPCTVHGEE